jgi:DNA-binding Xre family transcriptional regulator
MECAIIASTSEDVWGQGMARWRLREIAEPERWNARKIAQATGLAYNTVWGMWTNNTRRADLDTLEKLAHLLQIQPGDLIGAGEPDTVSPPA